MKIYIEEAKKKLADQNSKEFHKEFFDSEEEHLKALDDLFGPVGVTTTTTKPTKDKKT